MSASWGFGIITCGFFMTLSTIASAGLIDDIFKVDRQNEICITSSSGDRIVGKFELARAIADEIGIPLSLLDRANPKGEADSCVTAKEVKFVFKADDPFEKLSDDEKLRRIKESIQKVQGQLTDFLNSRTSPYQGYEVLSNVPNGPVSRDFFAGKVRIKCITIDGIDWSPEFLTEISRSTEKRLRLRSKIDELAKDADNRDGITSIGPAELSFRKNKDGSNRFQVNLVAGYEVSTIDQPFHYIPYVRYERNDIDPDKEGEKDIHVVSPGLLFDYFLMKKPVSAEFGISPTATLDIEQGSEILKLKGFASPSSDYVLLGGYSRLIGPLLFRPDINLLVETGHVFDRGTSKDLDDNDEYWGLGGETSLKLKLPEIEIFSDFVASVNYRHLELFSGEIDSVNRFKAALTYSFPDSPNMAVKFSYEDGENEETFQDEDFWKISLGVRY